ncbi:unnamed protein product [Larinioides sclopetarius]|uniref:Uncharacterized protein n=1 Tax=Larinioides sclopetarius TaxID=280406 RepID=A0AAV2B1C9_9ARAC
MPSGSEVLFIRSVSYITWSAISALRPESSHSSFWAVDAGTHPTVLPFLESPLNLGLLTSAWCLSTASDEQWGWGCSIL